MVITWLNKAREAEDKRQQSVTAPPLLEGDCANEGDITAVDEDEDHDEFVYDIQASRPMPAILTFSSHHVEVIFH